MTERRSLRQYVPPISLAVIVTIALAAIGGIYAYGRAMQQVEANADVNATQWRSISGNGDKIDELRDRVSRIEGKIGQ